MSLGLFQNIFILEEDDKDYPDVDHGLRDINCNLAEVENSKTPL